MAEKKVEKIIVKSKSPTFRRAGIEFTRDGVELDPAELTPEQAEAISNEPNLVIAGGEITGTKKAKKA